MMRTMVSVLVMLSLFLCMACAHHVAIPPPPVAPALSQEEIIEALKNNAAIFSSLKSFIKAKVDFPEKGKTRKQSFDAAILFRKEDQALRFQGFGPFGKMLFDLLWKQNDLTVYLPSSALAYHGSPDEITTLDRPHIFSMLGDIIAGIGQDVNPEGCVYEEDKDTLWIRNDRFTYALRINRQTVLIEKKSIIQNGEVMAEVLYQGYQSVNGNRFPNHMTLFFPPQGVTMELAFETPTLNENLPASLFSLTIPANVTWLPLAKLQIDFLL